MCILGMNVDYKLLYWTQVFQTKLIFISKIFKCAEIVVLIDFCSTFSSDIDNRNHFSLKLRRALC
jgi:hypothetical protein